MSASQIIGNLSLLMLVARHVKVVAASRLEGDCF